MAVGACEDRVVGGIGVASCADSVRPAVRHVEPSVIESGARP